MNNDTAIFRLLYRHGIPTAIIYIERKALKTKKSASAKKANYLFFALAFFALFFASFFDTDIAFCALLSYNILRYNNM